MKMKKIKIKFMLTVLFCFAFINAGEKFYNKSENTQINLIDSNIRESIVSFSFNDYELEEVEINNQVYYKAKIDGGTQFLSLGNPDVPTVNTSIIIPDYANMKAEIISASYTDIENVNLAPSKGNLSRLVFPENIPFSFSENYNENSFYPSNIVSLGDPYILREHRGQSVNVYPIQYNPVTKILRFYSDIQIKITEDLENQIENNILQRKISTPKVAKDFNSIYENLFINYNSNTRFNYLNDYGSMLIICFDDFINQMQPFVEWKNKKGISTEIIGSNQFNSVSDIQNFINTYYYENNLTYLLLVGDVAQIPTPIINGASSDPSYGFIDGNDSFAEVIVGRFSANNPGELQTQIDRTLNYEQNPTSTDYLNKALGIASAQGPGYGGLSDDDFNDLLWNDFLSDYTYSDYQGLYDSNGGSVSAGVDAINNGVGIINYTGHAGPTGWGNGAALSNDDVHQLTNSGMLPFIFTVGCNPGEFNNYGECFCEAWMRATDDNGNPTGAIAHVGSTISQSWEPPMHGQWAMNSILTESYEDNVSRSFGGIVVNGCMHMNEAQGSNGVNETNHWTIFGDPSVLIRTDEPSYLNPSYDNSIVVGQSEFVIDVGTEGALVALSSNGNLIASDVSQGGVVVLDISDISITPGTLDLVITSFNTFPYQSTVSVITPDSAYLIFNDIEIVSTSDFNDSIDYGDTVEMNLVIENVGTLNTNGVNVSIASNDDYVTIVDSESVIGYAISGSTATTDNTLSFSIANNVPDLHMISFDCILNDGNQTWQSTFSLQAHAPVFEIQNTILIDENEDGTWDPGEQATINLDLINSGSASFNYYPGATITTDNQYITIISGDSDNTFFGIGENTTYQGSFIVQANEDIPSNTNVEFNISWGYSPTAPCDNEYFNSNGCVEQANLVYSAIVGHPPILVWDPSVQHLSGLRLVEYFNDNNISGYDYLDSAILPNIQNYSTVFILLGVYDQNYVLNEGTDIFVEFLNNGGNIYMEGADTWAFDASTNLHSMFGISPIADGSADLNEIVGIPGTFAGGLTFTYNGGNSYIDRLDGINGGFPLLKNISPEYYTAIAYENDNLGYKTIGASHELGGLQGLGFDSYVDGILNFFSGDSQGGGGVLPPPSECTLGDVNSDGVLDITDIVRQINIVLNIGDNPSDDELCAADFNDDGLINVLDIILVVNQILDT